MFQITVRTVFRITSEHAHANTREAPSERSVQGWQDGRVREARVASRGCGDYLFSSI
jgi:hypothetical protein